MNILTKKKIDENTGCIICDYAGSNSLAFLAKLPKNATVDRIKVDGVYLEDLREQKIITLHKELMEGELRVAATVVFPADVPALHEKASHYLLTEFEVYYHEEAITEG